MNTKKLLLTLIMLHSLSTPIFASESQTTYISEFLPVDSLTKTTILPAKKLSIPQEEGKSVPAAGQMEGVMFYIPVYTMSVTTDKAPAAAAPAAAAATRNAAVPAMYSDNSPSNTINPMPPIIAAPVIPDNNRPDIGTNNPNISQSTPTTVQEKKNPNLYAVPLISLNAGKFAVFKKGTKLKVQLCNDVTNIEKHRSRVTLRTIEPVSTTFTTLPIGTLIKGNIARTREPQIFGNGALVELEPNKIVINDYKSSPVEAKVIKVEDKKVFFNNIKGRQTYFEGIKQAAKDGEPFFEKMHKKTVSFANRPATALLSPFPMLAGGLGYCAYAVAAPFKAVKTKGADVLLAENTELELKLKKDWQVPIN